MKYFLSQKMFAFGNDFSIKDEQGTIAYYIDGKSMTFGDQLSFQDSEGTEIAFISQKLMSFFKTFEITQGNTKIASIKKIPLTFFNKIEIDLYDENPLLVSGDMLGHEYTFTCGKQTVASVSKKYMALHDKYLVDIDDAEMTLVVLCSAVILDLIFHYKNNED